MANILSNEKTMKISARQRTGTKRKQLNFRSYLKKIEKDLNETEIKLPSA